SAALDLSLSYPTSGCTGTGPYPLSINPNKNDTVYAYATPTDSDSSPATGTTQSNTVTVVNSAPAPTVSLGDHSPKTNDLLTATATRSDADGDAVSLHYVWKNGSTVVRDVTKSAGTSADLTDSLNLALAGNGNKGDTITVEVTPNDGTVDGSTVNDS